MNEWDVFDALRAEGVDADRPEVRKAVRVVADHIAQVRAAEDADAARRCLEAMAAAARHMLNHPEIDDMQSFEADFEDGSGVDPDS